MIEIIDMTIKILIFSYKVCLVFFMNFKNKDKCPICSANCLFRISSHPHNVIIRGILVDIIKHFFYFQTKIAS